MRPTHHFVRLGALSLFASLLMTSAAYSQAIPIYRNPHASLEARVNDLFGRLTEDEKLGFLTGTGFTTQPIPRLGVPAMGMADAGQGVRGGVNGTLGPATLFPSGVTMASSWDTALISKIGQAIGEEALNKGVGAHVVLGPAIDIHRSPLGGRNGEYFSEDPYLAARLTVNYVKGMQSTGCAACVKHYACNNEEVDRGFVNVHVSERALREIYLPAYRAGVKEGHAWTIMAAYNKLRGHYITANHYLLTDVLKDDWGFDGIVMSDWGAVHETAGALNAGTDLEMPGGDHFTRQKIAAALASGATTQHAIDEAVRRILRTIIRVGLLNGVHHPDHSIVNSPAHQRLAYQAAAGGIVLLKNEGNLLPLNRRHLHSIAVIGPAAVGFQAGAAGSPGLTPFFTVNPLDGIKKRAGAGITINYAPGTDIAKVGSPVPTSALFHGGGEHGLSAEYFPNQDLRGTPALTRVDPQIDFNWDQKAPGAGVGRTSFSVRWTGTIVAPTTGQYKLFITSDDGCRLFLDGKALIDSWHPRAATTDIATAYLTAGRQYPIRIEYFQGIGEATIRFGWLQPGQKEFTDAIDAARKSDVAVVFVTTSGTEGEGQDRPSMALPGAQDDLIRAVAGANKKTIVVLNNGTPCLMSGWLNRIRGLVEMWFPGEDGGDAIAAILFGDVNPSGKLPDTLAVRREDYPDYGNFPGKNGQVYYAEGIYVGYRYFDKKGIKPYYPFGYGLSYTTFRYSNLRLSRPTMNPRGTLTASLNVTNTGHRAGAEVVELYIHEPAPRIDRPVRELKGFTKINLAPGQTKRVTFELDPQALAYCDVPGKQWRADAGPYDVEIGASSRDIRLTKQFRLTGRYTRHIPGMVTGPVAENNTVFVQVN
ncbi:MAG TPA: glycoside hydrolase family 3 C-terminal domain-containing protein [Armatimonadota bacterium]|nr:glycoside hydrolase family 3 C-terminal domain-containing protein [Armatimonadota bacterium]